MNTDRRNKQPGIPAWLIPNSPEWNRVIEHSQKTLGMTARESWQDLMERRNVYLRQTAQGESSGI